MAGKRDIVWVADRIVAQLQASLPAKLDALVTEYNDGIALPNIPNSRMFVAERVRPPGTPMIVVMPDRSDANAFSGENRYGIEYHFLTAAVMDGGNLTDEDRLKRRAGRYVRAVEEVMIDNRTLSGSVNNVLVIEKNYGPLLMVQSGLLQEGQVSLRVQTL